MPDRPLVVVAVGGQVLFLVSWLALGAVDAGHDPLEDTISALAALGSPVAGPALAGFAAQGLGQVANAVLAARRGAHRLGVVLAVAGSATLAAGALRLPGPSDDGGWVASGHTAAAVAAFTALHVAVLLGALDHGLPRWSRRAAWAALAVALPHTAWLVALLGGGGPVGYTEKAMTFALVAWTAVLPLASPARPVARRDAAAAAPS
ncbi:DUF998 domain-containing protein [Thalassiella azotivora]